MRRIFIEEEEREGRDGEGEADLHKTISDVFHCLSDARDELLSLGVDRRGGGRGGGGRRGRGGGGGGRRRMRRWVWMERRGGRGTR